MTNPVDLARQARAGLAEAESVTLLIQGIGRTKPITASIAMHDDAGRPTFWCPADSAVAGAAGRYADALLTIECGGSPAQVSVDSVAPKSVIIGGRLSPRREAVSNLEQDLVEIVLIPLQVFLEFEDELTSRVIQYEVNREDYLAVRMDTEPPAMGTVEIELPAQNDQAADELAREAGEIVAHSNADHQNELRHFVARRHGRSVHEIAGALLVSLDAHGTRLHWIDADGAHAMAVSFLRPARSGRELACYLGSLLRANNSPHSH
jgi:Protein of unknown function (DUF2470)